MILSIIFYFISDRSNDETDLNLNEIPLIELI